LKKMNNIKKFGAVLLSVLTLAAPAFAGNPDRAGQAGGTQLLVNPWARSAGWGGVGMAGIKGVEAMSFNVAGLVQTGTKMEFNLSRANWLTGTGTFINSFGMVQTLGESKSNAIGISIVSFDFGDIDMTTTSMPAGAGSYSIQLLNIGLGYSHKFSDNISGGVLIRGISEGVFNAKATGAALDAGIQYKAGKQDRMKFGVSLRNVGPTMTYSGDALAIRGRIEGSDITRTLQIKSNEFELPSILNIAGSYDLFVDSTAKTTLTFAASYTSNAFSKDQIGAGLQLGLFRKVLVLRAGYLYEPGMFSYDTRTNALRGPSAGLSLNLAFGKDKMKNFALDYAYRLAAPFGGTHIFGLRLNI
jgi:hypothetical protein